MMRKIDYVFLFAIITLVVALSATIYAVRGRFNREINSEWIEGSHFIVGVEDDIGTGVMHVKPIGIGLRADGALVWRMQECEAEHAEN